MSTAEEIKLELDKINWVFASFVLNTVFRHLMNEYY